MNPSRPVSRIERLEESEEQPCREAISSNCPLFPPLVSIVIRYLGVFRFRIFTRIYDVRDCYDIWTRGFLHYCDEDTARVEFLGFDFRYSQFVSTSREAGRIDVCGVHTDGPHIDNCRDCKCRRCA